MITETNDERINTVNGANPATRHIPAEGVVPNETFLRRGDDTVTSAGESLREASTSMRFLVHPKNKVRIGS